MVWHMQKRWRLKFRRDSDAGRVLFIGPLVVSLDVHRRDPSVALGCADDGRPAVAAVAAKYSNASNGQLACPAGTAGRGAQRLS